MCIPLLSGRRQSNSQGSLGGQASSSELLLQSLLFSSAGEMSLPADGEKREAALLQNTSDLQFVTSPGPGALSTAIAG